MLNFNAIYEFQKTQKQSECSPNNSNNKTQCKKDGRHKQHKEVWNVVKDVNKPKTESSWRLNEEGQIITDEKKINAIFNDYFISKIETLKDGIDENYWKAHCIVIRYVCLTSTV